MRAAIYNPYWDSLGGGERYCLSFARVLVELGYLVDIEWGEEDILEKLEERFGISTEGINVVKSINRGTNYDICFWLSDGSIPTLLSRKNVLHFQFPFKGVSGRSLLNRMKMYRISEVVVNSKFTKEFIDKEFGVNSKVLYPPVDVKSFKVKKKQNMILYVGRFSKLTQNKGQDILKKAFKKLNKEGYVQWRLVLAGGVEVGARKYLLKLKKIAKGYPIKFVESPSFKELRDLYARAKIFWSASGFGADFEKEPLLVEHFGMTVVEAMASGCVVVAYNAGGHKETVIDKDNGFVWEKIDDLVDKTIEIINEKKEMEKIAKEAIKASDDFSYEKFTKEVKKLL